MSRFRVSSVSLSLEWTSIQPSLCLPLWLFDIMGIARASRQKRTHQAATHTLARCPIDGKQERGWAEPENSISSKFSYLTPYRDRWICCIWLKGSKSYRKPMRRLHWPTDQTDRDHSWLGYLKEVALKNSKIHERVELCIFPFTFRFLRKLHSYMVCRKFLVWIKLHY